MTERDYDNYKSEVVLVLGEFDGSKPGDEPYRVQVYATYGWDPHEASFPNEEEALEYARKKARKTGELYRVIVRDEKQSW